MRLSCAKETTGIQKCPVTVATYRLTETGLVVDMSRYFYPLNIFANTCFEVEPKKGNPERLGMFRSAPLSLICLQFY